MSWIAELSFIAVGALLISASPAVAANSIKLVPYPQDLKILAGRLPLGPAQYVVPHPSKTTSVAACTLSRYLPKSGKHMAIRLGSVEEGYDKSWLSADESQFLAKKSTSPEASVVKIGKDGITVVGKGKWGMFYGAQTINQLLQEKPKDLPYVTIRDWPDMKWRCLSPTMTWYSGYNRLEGYDLCNWTIDEWKWLVDWSALHKCNGWAMCMYGNWPFTLPGYPETTLDVDSFFYNPATGQKEPWRFTHRNIRREFLPELIHYANERGVDIYAYIGKNSFNGTYGIKHPETNAGGAAELLPFAPGVHEYWDAVIARLIGIGFNGFVFEDPEAYHVPNQNKQCYDTFWAPWASTYGYSDVSQTDQNAPPLGVQVEYYSWLFKEFDGMIQKHSLEAGRPNPEIYLISHVLLSRIVNESKTPQERDKWFEYIDDKHGRKVPFVILEANEQAYVDLFGGDRVASLGGRGGSCTCAMFRIASINNDWCGGPMAADMAYERSCQKHIYEAGGFGAMGYIFEWTNTEVFGYIASQYLWRNSGVPGINNDDQTSFLYYAYRLHYGEKVGEMVARIMDESSCVNDQMVLEGVYGAQYPSTGAPLHRDYQLLAAIADRSVEMARKAYKTYTGKEPDLWHPVYNPDDFRWNGYDPAANKTFNAERLRLLYVSMRRSQKICETALAYRKSQKLIAEGASAGEVLESFDKAVEAAKENQRIYCINYDDDYDPTDGLCSRVVDELGFRRTQFVASISKNTDLAKAWTFDQPDDLEGWTRTNDLEPPVAKDGALVTRATGNQAMVEQTKALSVPVNGRCFVEIEIASDREGMVRLFWATNEDIEKQAKGAYTFSESRVRNVKIAGGNEMRVYRVSPSWNGTLSNLRFDVPAGASVRVDSIRIVELPESNAVPAEDLIKPVPEAARMSADNPIFIAWENLSDIVPKSQSQKPGLYLSTDIGFDRRYDYYRTGVVFTVQAQTDGGKWRTVFRRALGRRTTGWEHWEVPLGISATAKKLKLRFTTDSYSRAQDRAAPSWKWAVWGQPRLVDVTADGKRQVRYDFVKSIDSAKASVRLDMDGRERTFDAGDKDSTGATFVSVSPGPVGSLAQGTQLVDGFAEWATPPPKKDVYRSYLGSVRSGWAYAKEGGEISWRTASVPAKKPTVVTLIGGTGYVPGKAELWCDGSKLLVFDMGKPQDMAWKADGVELRYEHGGDTRSETTTYGISGTYVLMLPASKVTAGKPLTLTVKIPPDGGDWFMVHEYRSVDEATRQAMCPLPEEPSIAAFTPHVGGKFGVTIAEYEIPLSR